MALSKKKVFFGIAAIIAILILGPFILIFGEIGYHLIVNRGKKEEEFNSKKKILAEDIAENSRRVYEAFDVRPGAQLSVTKERLKSRFENEKFNKYDIPAGLEKNTTVYESIIFGPPISGLYIQAYPNKVDRNILFIDDVGALKKDNERVVLGYARVKTLTSQDEKTSGVAFKAALDEKYGLSRSVYLSLPIKNWIHGELSNSIHYNQPYEFNGYSKDSLFLPGSIEDTRCWDLLAIILTRSEIRSILPVYEFLYQSKDPSKTSEQYLQSYQGCGTRAIARLVYARGENNVSLNGYSLMVADADLFDKEIKNYIHLRNEGKSQMEKEKSERLHQNKPRL